MQYHFVSVDRFKEEIAKGAFIEWAIYAGNYYGTSVEAVKALKEKGLIALLDIDLTGVKSLKALPRELIDPFYITLVPSSIGELRQRIERRGDTSPESMRKRLDTALSELEAANLPGFYDRVIVSGDLDGTYAKFRQAVMDSQVAGRL